MRASAARPRGAEARAQPFYISFSLTLPNDYICDFMMIPVLLLLEKL